MILEEKHEPASVKAVEGGDDKHTRSKDVQHEKREAASVSAGEFDSCLCSKELRSIRDSFRESEISEPVAPAPQLSFSYLDPEIRRSTQEDILKMRTIRETMVSPVDELARVEARRQYEELLSGLEQRLKTQLSTLDVSKLTCEEREALLRDVERLQEVQQALHSAAAGELAQDEKLFEQFASINPELAARIVEATSSITEELNRKRSELYSDVALREMRDRLESGKGDVGQIIERVRQCREKFAEDGELIGCHKDKLCDAAAEIVQAHSLSEKQAQAAGEIIEQRRRAGNKYLELVDELVLTSYREYANSLLKIGERWPHLIEGYKASFEAVGALWEHTVSYRWTVGLSESSQPFEQRKLFMFLDETVRHEAVFWRGLQPWRAESAVEDGSNDKTPVDKSKAGTSLVQQTPDILGPVLEFSVVPTDKQSQREQKVREELRRKGIKISPGSATSVSERMAALTAEELLYDSED